MKAVKYMKYGGPEVVTIIDKEMPRPKSDEMLIRVHASSVSPAESAFRSADPFITRFFGGFFAPKATPGDMFAGEVVEAGADVKKFKPGDRVYGTMGDDMGSHAQYVTAGMDKAIVKLPDNVSYAEGSSIADGAITALPFLRDSGKIKSGDHILINGGSGSIGTFAIQLAKTFGATVTAVSSNKNHELLVDLGADHVIDYKTEDYCNNENTYDIVFDTVGKSSFKKAKRSLTEHGIFLTTVPALPEMIQSVVRRNAKGKRAVFSATGLRKAQDKVPDLEWMAELASEGKLTSVIDRTYKFTDVSEAHAYVDTGHKVGNVIVDFTE